MAEQVKVLLDKTDQKMIDAYPVLEDCVVSFKMENGRTAGLLRFMYTWAIIADFGHAGYNERWCYSEYVEAMAALVEWNGEGEPAGWHRHVNSGRRVDSEGNVYVNP